MCNPRNKIPVGATVVRDRELPSPFQGFSVLGYQPDLGLAPGLRPRLDAVAPAGLKTTGSIFSQPPSAKGDRAQSDLPASYLSNLDALYRKSWVVYCKPPFGSPEQVLAYLARYTHRVAITNSRLVRIEGEAVTFTWKDYADHERQREMTLTGEEFLRRFLLHVLPDRFVRIRYYGLLANRHREKALALCRQVLPGP
jgi:hypothetical protein